MAGSAHPWESFRDPLMKRSDFSLASQALWAQAPTRPATPRCPVKHRMRCLPDSCSLLCYLNLSASSSNLGEKAVAKSSPDDSLEWGHRLESPLHRLPFQVLKEGLDVIGPLQPVIDHEGMFENVHDQKGRASSQVAHIMLVDPGIEEPTG